MAYWRNAESARKHGLASYIRHRSSMLVLVVIIKSSGHGTGVRVLLPVHMSM
jgi:hypothetical protein